jgi:hypothetical protein
MRHQYDEKLIRFTKAHCKGLIEKLCQKRNNEVYNGKSIVEMYEEAVRNNKVKLKKPFWEVREEDEVDELLKMRVLINMIPDGNCSVYAIMSQLYPQTYGGYELSPDPSAYAPDHQRATYNPVVQNKVKEIRKIVVEALNKYNAWQFGADDPVEERFSDMQDDTFLSINHSPGIATHYNKVIVIINPTETERCTSVFFSSSRM